MSSSTRLLVLLAGLSLIIAACGTDVSTSNTTRAEAATTTAPPATIASPETSTTVAEATTTTEVTTTTKAETAEVVPGDDPDVDAIVEVYQVVFDSTTTYEEKAPYIEDPEGLEGTVETYSSTGASVGGVTALPTEVIISGDTGEVVYTLYFSGNPTYPDLKGDATLTDEGWKVSRDMFCRVMASARSSCPAD